LAVILIFQISQGSGATHFRSAGILYDKYMGSFVVNLPVK